MQMDSKSGVISTGSEVVLDLTDRSGKKERLKIVIVDDKSADYSRGYMSENTPLARAVLGERAGTIIPYLKDDILSIEILTVVKTTTTPDDDRTNPRQARMKKTIRAVEDTNAMVFASSFSGKWGDYDPDSIPKDDQEEDQKPKPGTDQEKPE